ncbi:MAG: 30S ribosomal protein S15 [Euryarchaeota archaeon RBG_16_68_12]|nr:MAG: 30S ribosomal protein S15 [Euryarchaeota archaeon RBG_16_68_12]
MARIHAKRKGQHGSTRPLLTKNPEWVPLEADEILETVVKLHGEGLSKAAIGGRLRDQFGVPSVQLATGKSVGQILKAKGLTRELPEDLSSLMKRAVDLQVHLKSHRKDLSNKRGLSLTESKIRRLSRYYKEEGVLPSDWDYSRTLAELQVR